MTTREDYDEKEWDLIVFAPSVAANEIAGADGKISKAETLVITQFMLGAREKYKHNELITSVIESLPELLEAGDVPGELRYIKKIEEAEMVYRKIARIVNSKAPAKEAMEYKQFIVAIMTQVAEASGKFLGVVGDAVDENESDYEARIKKALGL